MKKILLALLLSALLTLLLSSCSLPAENGASVSDATGLIGEELPTLRLSAAENPQTLDAILYFRFNEQSLLSCETRRLSLQPNESAERAVVQALLDGPSAGIVDLHRLFPANTRVINTIAQEDSLVITFSAALLDSFEESTPNRRRLAMDSLIATITENFAYTRVQILVDQSDRTDGGSMRLSNTYYNDARLSPGPAAPLYRDEAVLLTHKRTAEMIFEAWSQRDWQTLYTLILLRDSASQEERPLRESALNRLRSAPYLSAFSVSAGSVSPLGSSAVFSAEFSVIFDEHSHADIDAFPLRLTREGGIWKISYTELMRLMQMNDTEEYSG